MIRVEEIRRRARRLWDSGRVLAATLDDDGLFPWRVPLRCPSGRQLAAHFDAVRDWSAALQRFVDRHGAELETGQIAHRTLGAQRLPLALIVPEPGVLAHMTDCAADLARFQALSDTVLGRRPVLHELLCRRPFDLLRHAEVLPRLLDVVDWIETHPRPGIYLRQLQIPGVDSKLIESHAGLLDEMLRRVLPASAIDGSVTSLSGHGFERRYGFAHPQRLIRYRQLEVTSAGERYADVAVPQSSFCSHPLAADTVIITENQINGLAFPALRDAVVIFGLGYGVTSLFAADWLKDRRIVYWGDIDTHGFAILDRLRGRFAQVRSLLMDAATLHAHRALWGVEPAGRRHLQPLAHLSDDEQQLYEALRHDQWAEAVRLEQERIGYDWVERAVAELDAG